MMRNLRQTAADLGLPFGERKKTYNSRLAQELESFEYLKDTEAERVNENETHV